MLPPGTMTVDYTLPVVFHIINSNPSSITDAAVIAALQSMNEAFSITGAYTGGRTDTRIQFCMAKTDPNGGKTTGIVRTKTYLGDFDYDMEGGDMVSLGRWDPSRYVNIWVVEDIKSEYMQTFECGVWTRLKMGGYAGAGGDIVVAGLGTDLMCHETGHYLSLAHTFANRDCANTDCNTDGDMVCDTPPERTITGGYACASPQNSCSTDTLSGFATDVPDLPDNFMDYGNGTGCIISFTEGQAERMRNFIATSLTGMIGSTLCTEPCTDAVNASFTTSKDYPIIGDVVNFTNTSAGRYWLPMAGRWRCGGYHYRFFLLSNREKKLYHHTSCIRGNCRLFYYQPVYCTGGLWRNGQVLAKQKDDCFKRKYPVGQRFLYQPFYWRYFL